jgi:hypothetical protein
MDEPILSSLFYQALTELREELQAIHRPTLPEILEEYLPLPRNAVFFGVAQDGLPLLLDLGNAAVGSLLVIGDAGSGKTHLLRTVAHALVYAKDAATFRFVVITPRVEEWEDLRQASHCDGVFAASASKAADVIYALAARAHADREHEPSTPLAGQGSPTPTAGKGFTLLLLDDLSLVQNLEYEIRLHLQWLLGRGPKRRIWTVATLTPQHFFDLQMLPWTGQFHTHLFARVADSRQVQQFTQLLSLPPDPVLGELRPPAEYALVEGDHWLRFWNPEESGGRQ